MLLAVVRVQFVTSSAPLDLAQAESLTWAIRA
jgi:hypothetical protein